MIPKFRTFITIKNVVNPVQPVSAINFESETITIEQGLTFPFDKVILMQSTGLEDKNGVEIYEGDILYHPLQGKRKVYYPYSDSVASYGLREINTGFGSTLQDAHAVWEVIGNIHENPELLEVDGIFIKEADLGGRKDR